MAAIERGEGASDAVVQGWLARALTAPRGPQWVCEKCNHAQGAWGPVCDHCGAFDTLSWVTPEADGSGATGAHMLPMIVGAIADKGVVPVDDTQDTPTREEDPAEADPVEEPAPIRN